jgi:hypothetical protein
VSDLPDQAQIPIGRFRKQRGVPQPQADDEYERADQGDGLEDTAAGPNRSLLCFVVHGRVNDSVDRLSRPVPPDARLSKLFRTSRFERFVSRVCFEKRLGRFSGSFSAPVAFLKNPRFREAIPLVRIC